MATVKLCDKCLKDDEEQVNATHHCSACNMNYCDNHISLHSTATKTKGHGDSVTKLISVLPPYLPSLNLQCVLSNLSRPSCCCIDPNHGSLFVANDLTVVEFDLVTKRVKNSFKELDENAPVRMRYDRNDDALVYAIDRGANYDVVKTSRDGKMLHWSINKQSKIVDLCIDRGDGTIHTIQKDGIVSIKNGKVVSTFRDDVCGQNMFVVSLEYLLGITTDIDNNLVLTSNKSILRVDKFGNILSKIPKASPGTSCRMTVEPCGQFLYYVGDVGIESTRLDGTCLTKFNNNEKVDSDNIFEFSGGAGLDMAIDFSTGEFYVVNLYKKRVQVFK